MPTRPKYSEHELLERYRIALENAEAQPQIASVMSEFGYDTSTIAEGKAIFQETRQAYDFNKKEDDETSEAYNIFSTTQETLANLYNLHRKKAKIIFRNQPMMLNKLYLSGTKPQAYIKWLETVKKFYTETMADTKIQTKLARLKITKQQLITGNKLITEVESSRANYLREKGESQDATRQKDAAFAKLEDWMSEFYAVSKIALEDNLQLLESLGKVVKN